MPPGVPTARQVLRPPKRVPWAPPAHLRWRLTYKNWGANPAPPGAPYYGPKWPKDNPWTYKNASDYSQYAPWAGKGDPLPRTDAEWRSVVRDTQYTRYHARAAVQDMFATKVSAGVEHPSPADERAQKRARAPYDIRQPLQLQLKQMKDANDAWRQGGRPREKQLWEDGNDPFLSPLLSTRDYSDSSRHSAAVRMQAMRLWRTLGPDGALRVPVGRIRALAAARRAGHSVSAAQQARSAPIRAAGSLGGALAPGKAPAAELPLQGEALEEWLQLHSEGGTIGFDAFLSLFTLGQETYYKLGGHDVPGDMAVTGSTAFPLGPSHGGIPAYAAQGRWAHG